MTGLAAHMPTGWAVVIDRVPGEPALVKLRFQTSTSSAESWYLTPAEARALAERLLATSGEVGR